MSDPEYDLLVIGSGPAGHHAAIQGAKLHKRVLLAERRPVLGGLCINVGTIPSKTLREAILYLSGYREHSIYGAAYKVKERITLQDMLVRVEPVVRHEIDVTRHQLIRNGVELVSAEASFADRHHVRLVSTESHAESVVSAARIVIAVGSEPSIPAGTPLDGHTIFSSDDILQIGSLPQTLTVIGGGVIGCEYASMFAALDVRVTLIDMRDRILPFVDDEIVEALLYRLREQRVTMRLGEKVERIETIGGNGTKRVRLTLASGKEVISDKVLCCAGRVGATGRLNLEAAGLPSGTRGKLSVNRFYQTAVSHIYAAGDVIGFPSLASTSMEQGRLAACHAFDRPATYEPELFPYGIYTIPEISFVGRTERELTDQGVPYEIGKAQYREIARGHIVGDNSGMLKLIFHRKNRELLGVHIIGEGAVELVHIGQAVLAHKGTVDYFIGNVFNYPTLAECYKTAAFDGINRLS
jgi:NAD(P) transhydrogenase